MDRSYVDKNALELERMRALVARLDDESLHRPVNEYWTVAGVLGHIAFWDGRALFMATKLASGVAFTPSDGEPEDVDWINDASRPLLHAIPARVAAELALATAQETDDAVAALPAEVVSTLPAESPLTPLRAAHRGEHLDEIEAALA